MIVKTKRIKWDTDNSRTLFESLPQKITIDIESEDQIADAISDKYGYCIFNLEYKIIKKGI